jgi:ABC-type transport system substrate-binding protein
MYIPQPTKVVLGAALLLLSATAIFLGCGPTPEGGGGGGDKADVNVSKLKPTVSGKEPAEDDVLLRYYGDDPDTLNPITASDSVSSAFFRQVYEPLARRNYGDPKQWEPVLAESWEFDEPSLTYTIHLRRGVMWQPITLPNGKELPPKEFTSKDVAFTFACLLNPYVEAASKRNYYIDPSAETEEDRIKIEVTVVDDYTVKVRWKKPYFLADDYTLGGEELPIIPRHVFSVDKDGEPISLDFTSKEFGEGLNSHWASTKACGTGPLILKEWKQSDGVKFVRNPDYWGPSFYFSRMEYRYISNSNTAFQKLMQNELDFGGIPEINLYLSAKDNPNVKSGKVKLFEMPVTAYRYIGYNLDSDLFNDRDVRWALSHAVPVDEIIDKIYHGLAERVTGPFLPGDFSDPDVKPVSFDLEESKRLLEKAGWKDTNNNGIRDKMIEGKLVEFQFDTMIFADSPQYSAMAEIIKANFRQIGVEMLISPTKWGLFLQKLNKKEFDAMILGWTMDWKGDPSQLWHSHNADLPDSSNFGYRNPEVDALIEKLQVTMDEKKQIPLFHEIHRLIAEDQPYTFLYSELATGARDARLENVKFYKMLRPHYDVREWYTTHPRKQGG